MLSLQEIFGDEQIKKNLHSVYEYMEENKSYNPSAPEVNLGAGLKRSQQRELSETLHRLTLAEVLMRVNTPNNNVGAGGYADYLIPSVLSKTLYLASSKFDKVPLMVADIIMNPVGDSGYVNGGVAEKPTVSSGLDVTHDTFQMQGAAFDLKKMTVGAIMTNELLEDQQYNLVDWHIKQAGLSIGKMATRLACAKFVSSKDGYGTAQTANAGAATTSLTNIGSIIQEVSAGEGMPGVNSVAYTFKPDLMITTTHSWFNTINATLHFSPGTDGFDFNYGGLNTVIADVASMYISAATTTVKGYTIVACKDISFVAVRKSWLKVENYTNPVEDLAGAVITGRQDAVSLNNASVGILTET